MATVIRGTDSSASAPALTGADSDTGVYFPAANQVALATNGTQALIVDSSQNVGIGTSSPTARLTVVTGAAGNNEGEIRLSENATYYAGLRRVNASDEFRIGSYGASQNITFYTVSSERMRIDSSGNLLVGGTSFTQGGIVGSITASATGTLIQLSTNATGNKVQMQFNNPNGQVGYILTNGSGTTYATSSDYRLKYDIQPMTGALAKVAALKPCIYKWNVDDSAGEGFIAHELAEVCPYAVTGEKDAVDKNGNPVYQGIDTSFLIATLTAAIQELKAINDAQAETITALTARVTALEQTQP